MIFNPAKLKKQTIALLVLVATGTLSLQVDWVKDHVIPLLANHPHLSSLGTGLIFILTLLHSPMAMKVLESFSSEETTDLPGGGKVVEKIESTKVQSPPTE